MKRRIFFLLLIIFFTTPSFFVSCEAATHIPSQYSGHSISKSTITSDEAIYLTFLPIIISGKEAFYVSPEGNDSNPGSFTLPWRTIKKATDSVVPGDIVYVRDGLYNEIVIISKSGTINNPIKFFAYPGENPIIDGNYQKPGVWGTMVAIQGDYITFSGFEVRNSLYMGIVIYGNYSIVDNVYVHHCNENGVLITKGHHSTVKNSKIWKNVLANEFNKAENHSSGLSAARGGVSYATISNNIVWENWGEGISSYEADHTIIERNYSYNNLINMYISDSTNVSVNRNFVFMNEDSYLYPYSINVGIMMGDEKYIPPSSDIQIINNIVYNNKVNFWWWQGVQGGGMNNVLIANNTFVNATSPLNLGRGNVTISSGDHYNVHFVNNLIQQDNDLPVIATSVQPGISYSHNLWSKKPYDAASGVGDVIGDPKLIKVGSPFLPEWFKLSSTSLAINKALSIPQVTVDYFGQLRGTLPDIGADELDQ